MARHKQSPVPQQRAARPFIGLGPVLGVIAFGLYLNTLGHGYVLDDPLAITKNELVRRGVSGIADLFTHHYRAGTEGADASALLYRPLSLVSFAVEWSIAPEQPWIGHWMNALWYALSVLLAFTTLRLLLKGYSVWWAATTVLLFATHPIHTEVVANIKSRDELLCLFFCLGALYAWLRALEEAKGIWWVGALGSYLLALLSKESAVMFWPVFPMALWFFRGQSAGKSILKSLPLLGPIAVFLLARAAVLGRASGESLISPMDNPIVEASSRMEYTATAFSALWEYLRLLIFPQPLLSDYSYRHLSVVNWTYPRAIVGLLTYGGLLILALWGLRRRQVWAFAPAAFLCSMALYSQLLITIGTLLGERLLYLPSLWFCLGLSWAIWRISGVDLKESRLAIRKSWPAAAVFALIAAGFSLQTLRRNADWKDNLTLFCTDVLKAPTSVRLRNGAGTELYQYLSKNEDLPQAERERIIAQIEEHGRAALDIRPNPVSFLNLGNAATARQRYDEAVRYYEEALRLSPQYDLIRINLARTYTTWGRIEGRQNNNLKRCTELLEKAVAYGANEPDVWLDLGTAYGLLGDNHKAIEWFERVVQRDPSHTIAWRNLAVAYRAVGEHARAEACERKAAGR
jgi:Tfp pilus assembly protein PilF